MNIFPIQNRALTVIMTIYEPVLDCMERVANGHFD